MQDILRKTQLTMCHFFLAGMVLVVLLQVIGRRFNIGVEWTEEVSRFFFVSFVFISASYATLTNSDLRIGMLYDLLVRLIGKKPMRLLIFLLLITFDFMMVVFCFQNLMDGIRYPSISPSLGFNTNYLYALVMLGFLMSAIGRLLNINTDDKSGEQLQ
ncbi:MULTISPECIES: TRAP transporter small permease subunit [Halomonadaceae]|uniref:TRAP transporter small permease protein n=2 Tax=Vreelandella TaxID=3137766 RepID=A0A7Z0LTK9_9GAMM|nr:MULTISPECIES: TRAP transporter small permease subunit [Halomonas]NYS78280.1 TRAP transporter small permease subunit [Halomonas glaciei]|tara:strand:- start:3912 stop:4385 length:474 start_codon:yes stop_codon:yes gene_type:complete